MKRHETTVKVYDEYQHQYEGDWPPENAVKFLEWFHAHLNTIPAEYRESTKIEIGSGGGYDGYAATLEITYERPETDAELEERMERVRSKEATERRTLEKLQAKYDKP